jgi:hypothetical protein
MENQGASRGRARAKPGDEGMEERERMNDLLSVRLLAACEDHNMARIAYLWGPVVSALASWRKRMEPADYAPYASLLGDEDPGVVAAAVLELAHSCEWRPAAADVYQHMHPPGPEPEPQRPAAGVTRRPDNSDAAYRAVMDEVVMGAEVCDCVPRSPQWTIDRHGVLWCPDCGNLEPGQYDQALEHQNPSQPEPPAPTAEDVRRWARDEQLRRLRQGKPPSPFLRKVMGGDDDAIRKLAATFGLSFEARL